MNKKSLMIATLSLGMAFTAGSSFAADLENGFGASCDGTGTWHFVNNQTAPGAAQGTITAYFGCQTVVAGADRVNQRNQHFNVATTGDCTLLDAMTDLDGRLVLSDYTCTPIKK